MSRVINYSAGPAAIPTEVLEQARDEMLNWQGTGCSVMEVSHRGKDYEGLHMATMDLFREVAGLPADYNVLFTTGGASTQFLMLPMNYLGEGKEADYILTGNWAQGSMKEAKRYGKVTIPANMEVGEGTGKFVAIPKQEELKLNPNAEYVHITSNNTVEGTQWHYIPNVNGKPLVADMSSDIFSRPLDYKKFSMIYAGAQKNLGPSGVTVVAIKEDFLQKSHEGLPPMLSYRNYKDKKSMHNTPPCFSIYILNLVLNWIKKNGGLEAIGKINEQKKNLLYSTIDNSNGYYQGLANADARSWMNIDFKLPNPDLDAKFVADAKAAGIVQTKGYRTMGGIRLSAYNAVSLKDVETTGQFMQDFANKNKA